MQDCVFCNFKDKEVVVYDDNLCFAAISLNPINKYHIMVIPKKHYENLVDLPDKLAAHLFLVTKKLSAALRKACNPIAIHHISDDDILKKGYNLVAHYKIHLIPRFENDGIKIEWNRQDLDLKARTQVAMEIRSCLDGTSNS